MSSADLRLPAAPNHRRGGLARLAPAWFFACSLLPACSQTMVDHEDGRPELYFAGVKVKHFHEDRGRFPADLTELLQPSSHGEPYLPALPVDRFGRTVLYVAPTAPGRSAKIGSFGRDGRAGGAGEDLDLWIDVDG